jgi:excisionase family DNA binding protein
MPTLVENQEFFSPPEVAEILRVSHSKILTWIAAGELRASDLASHRGQRPRWKVSRADLESFLARRSTTAPPEPRRRRRSQDNVTQYY